MSTENRVKASVSEFKGQKSGFPIESYGLESAIEAKNFLLKEGALVRMNGGNQYANITSSPYGDNGGITSLHWFQNKCVAQRYQNVFCESAEGSASFTAENDDESVRLTSLTKLLSAPWRDSIFLNNGQDAIFLKQVLTTINTESIECKRHGLSIDDGNVSQLSAAWFSEVAGGTLAQANYFYLITFYDEDTNTESPGYGEDPPYPAASGLYELSPNGTFGAVPASFTTSVVNRKVHIAAANFISFLQGVQAEEPRVSHFTIYRTTKTGTLYNTFQQVPCKNGTSQDGDVLVRISTFITNNTDFVDDTVTASLGADLPTNNSPPPTPVRLKTVADANQSGLPGDTTNVYSLSDYSGFKHMKFFRDQLFGIGALSPGISINGEVKVNDQNVSGRILDFKDVLHGSEVFQPDYFTYLWEVGRGDGQASLGLGVLGDAALLIFKQRSTYYLSGSSPSDYVVRILDTNKGCVHASTIQETPIGVICLDRSGFVLFNKIAQGERISRAIQDVIDGIDFSKSNLFYSGFDAKNQRYYCAIIEAPFTTPNKTLFLDLDSMEWTYTQGNEGLARVTDTNSSDEFVDLVGSPLTGQLNTLSNEELINFNDGAIESIWTSGPVDFGDNQHKKKLRWLYLRARCNEDFNVGIEIIPDYDEGRKYSRTFDSLVDYSTWYSSDVATDGSLIWDEGAWAGVGGVRRVCKIPVICKGYSFQVRIINTDTDTRRFGFTIEGISLEGEIMDK